MPDWYCIIDAAQVLNVPPWELLDVPKYWLDAARQYKEVDMKLKSV